MPLVEFVSCKLKSSEYETLMTLNFGDISVTAQPISPTLSNSLFDQELKDDDIVITRQFN